MCLKKAWRWEREDVLEERSSGASFPLLTGRNPKEASVDNMFSFGRAEAVLTKT
jgi:hypothetical protein